MHSAVGVGMSADQAHHVMQSPIQAVVLPS